MRDEILIFSVLGVTLAMFVWGRVRYDLVAMMALLAVTILGLVDPAVAFLGFGHPAVITVAAILAVSKGLQNAGVVDIIAKALKRVGNRPTVQVGALGTTAAICSAFMNNVGALALLMPVALRMARSAKRSPAYLLMPLAFCSLLGGLMTLIGSPPNIIVSSMRRQAIGEPFGFFDFAPVGAGVTIVGIAFIALLGWRLLPDRKPANGDTIGFDIAEYTAELTVTEDSKFHDATIQELATAVDADFVILAILRGERRLSAPSGFETIHKGDTILVAADHEAIKALRDAGNFELAGEDNAKEDETDAAKDLTVVEAIVGPGSVLAGRTPAQLNLRWRYGVNLLGVSRQGSRVRERLRDARLQTGDVLMLHIPADNTSETLSMLGCLPLAERAIDLAKPRRLLLGTGIFVCAVAATVVGLLPVQIAFVLAAVLMLLTRVVTLREGYDAVDWPVIVLLGAMIPLGDALDSTGGTQRIADLMLWLGEGRAPIVALAILMIVTLLLSDVVNNAAVAVLMAPVAVRLAEGMNASVDAFLMGVVLGASSAFLTPIGHQSNTLVLAPGGYRFGDYARMGVPLTAIYVVVGLVMISIVWPLRAG